MNTSLDKLIEHKQGSLIRDMAEHYFENWVKETKEFDPFFFKVCKLAFLHGDEENRFAFMKRMIRVTCNKNLELAQLIAEGYKEKGEYLKSYVYSISANMPHLTVDLLLNHIIDLGYINEADLFKLRAVLEYMLINKTDSAQVLYEKLWSKKDDNPHKNMAKAIILV